MPSSTAGENASRYRCMIPMRAAHEPLVVRTLLSPLSLAEWGTRVSPLHAAFAFGHLATILLPA